MRWKRRSGALPAGTRPIRMRKSGIISPAPRASGARSSRRWRHEMGVRSIKMPDVGEGVAEAEIVEWAVKVGDLVKEDQVVAAVMTDKATGEIPTPVAGSVLTLGGAVGDVIAVGAELIRIDAPVLRAEAPPRPLEPRTGAPRPVGEKPLASPAVRLNARETGVDLRFVRGSGPAGRITHQDLDAYIARPPEPSSERRGRVANKAVE